jgi:hypothetical protein
MGMLKAILVSGMLTVMLVPCAVIAQKIDRLEFSNEPGDKVVYKWTLGTKSQQYEQVFNVFSDTEVRGVGRVGGKSFEIILTKVPFLLKSSICLSNGQACTFSPGILILDLPLENGKKWTTTFTAKGDTFTSDVTQERKVEAFEKVRVPAGEYDAVKISFSGRIQSRNTKGELFPGTEEGTDWFAFPSGRPLLVKTTYRNSFGEKYSAELISATLK